MALGVDRVLFEHGENNERDMQGDKLQMLLSTRKVER